MNSVGLIAFYSVSLIFIIIGICIVGVNIYDKLRRIERLLTQNYKFNDKDDKANV
jgi:hypothetical protein